LDNTTTIMSDKSEPQPDGSLLILPEYGGRTRENNNGDLVGSPEVIAGIASSTESVDFHGKRDDYEREGVTEYVVIAIRQKRVFWWHLKDGKYVPLSPDADGVIRSKVFPGLWLNPAALIRLDSASMLATLREGLASPEHAEFVKRLAAKRSSES